MRKIFSLLFMTTFLFVSCSDDGEVGPQGPQGPPGPAGEAIVGNVIDLETYDFNEDNDYTLFLDFDDAGVEVFESDAVLVYMSVGEYEDENGEPYYAFRQLPQTYYTDNGEEIQYNFDYTFFDINIFLDSSIPYENFDTIDDSYTDDLFFRIIIVPADFAENTNVNLSDYNAVVNKLNIDSSKIKKISASKK
ncbi:collagen-like protein [Zunongwangia sp. H14]|uniref:collagen-like protein n=1 Tax=Zunongwangia sp. H14 TaxID=3240792 RepID=UPI0035637036